MLLLKTSGISPSCGGASSTLSISSWTARYSFIMSSVSGTNRLLKWKCLEIQCQKKSFGNVAPMQTVICRKGYQYHVKSNKKLIIHSFTNWKNNELSISFDFQTKEYLLFSVPLSVSFLSIFSCFSFFPLQLFSDTLFHPFKNSLTKFSISSPF